MRMSTNQDQGPVIIDWCLGESTSEILVEVMQTMLYEADSAFEIGLDSDGNYELQDRVDPVIKLSVQTAAPEGTRPSDHLKRAWSATYSQTKRPSESFRESVRAVESAAIPIMCPADRTATLGRMIGLLRSSPSSWRTVFRPPSDVSSVETLMLMMQLLWKSQLDRHGTDDDQVPITVSQEESEAALHLAANLVHIFTSGTIASAK